MHKIKLFFMFLFSTLIISSCAIPTPYKMASSPEKFGYYNSLLQQDIYEITFNGNADTSSTKAYDYALLRAAETCYENGYITNNPGFTDLFNEKEIKDKIQPIIDKKLDKLKNFPCLIKEWINVDNELLCFSICAFPDLDGKFDCHVNNQCFSKEDPFDNLQKEINKKNEKFDKYLKKCDECFLLIYNPDSSKGNYCHFTDKLKKKFFSYKFTNIFFYDEDSNISIQLKKEK